MQNLVLVAIFLTATAAAEEEVVVRILGGPQVARIISEEMGYSYKGPVSDFAASNNYTREYFKGFITKLPPRFFR